MDAVNEQEYINNVAKSIIRSTDFIVENGMFIGALVGGIIITADISNKINPNLQFYESAVLRENIIRMRSHILPFINEGRIIYFNPSLREDPNFEVNINRKVGEGAFNYFLTTDELQTIFITLYPGIFHLNKNDGVKLTLRKYDNPKFNNIVLADFEIFKKKLNLPYHIYFLFMTF